EAGQGLKQPRQQAAQADTRSDAQRDPQGQVALKKSNRRACAHAESPCGISSVWPDRSAAITRTDKMHFLHIAFRGLLGVLENFLIWREITDWSRSNSFIICVCVNHTVSCWSFTWHELVVA